MFFRNFCKASPRNGFCGGILREGIVACVAAKLAVLKSQVGWAGSKARFVGIGDGGLTVSLADRIPGFASETSTLAYCEELPQSIFPVG
jgi:hypothetical protein